MEAPHLDLTSELLGVYSGDGGSSESGEDGDRFSLQYEQSQQLQRNTNNTPYASNPRRAKAGAGKHRKTVTKRTRLPLKWNRVRAFTDESEAQTFIQSFEGYNWRKGCNNKTSGGLKCYYICKENSLCKVMSLLHYDSKTNEVVIYQSDRPHCHGPTQPNGTSPMSSGQNGCKNSMASTSTSGQIEDRPDTKHFQVYSKEMPSKEMASKGEGNARPKAEELQVAIIGAKKIGGGRRRGLNDETIAIINRLFAIDPHIKPSQVQEELRKSGIPLLQNYHINNFLAKLRKQLKQAGEASGMTLAQHQSHGSSSRSTMRSRQHYSNEEYNDDGNLLMNNGRPDYYSDDANNSSTTDTWFNNPNPMSMVDINLSNPFDNESDDMEEGEDGDGDGLMVNNEIFDPSDHNIADEHRDTLLGLNESGAVTISAIGNGNSLSRRNSNSFSPTLTAAARRFSTNSIPSGAVPSSTTGAGGFRNNQSEVVSTSNGTRHRKRNFYFRDESTREGDNVSPYEDNIKGLIIQHIHDNYSNRDMLHIREELQTLKDMKKFRSLNRLLSFTAGFLQDSFLDTTTLNSATRSPNPS